MAKDAKPSNAALAIQQLLASTARDGDHGYYYDQYGERGPIPTLRTTRALPLHTTMISMANNAPGPLDRYGAGTRPPGAPDRPPGLGELTTMLSRTVPAGGLRLRQLASRDPCEFAPQVWSSFLARFLSIPFTKGQ